MFIEWIFVLVKSQYVITMKSYFSKLDTMYLKDSNVFRHTVTFSSVQFSRSVVSDSLRPHESQHARPPCPSPTPGVHSRPSSQWCHPAISSSVIPSPPAPNPSHKLIIFVCMHHCTDVQCTITCQASLSTGILQARILEFITE